MRSPFKHCSIMTGHGQPLRNPWRAAISDHRRQDQQVGAYQPAKASGPARRGVPVTAHARMRGDSETIRAPSWERRRLDGPRSGAPGLPAEGGQPESLLLLMVWDTLGMATMGCAVRTAKAHPASFWRWQ